jgi:hypothetical protein
VINSNIHIGQNNSWVALAKPRKELQNHAPIRVHIDRGARGQLVNRDSAEKPPYFEGVEEVVLVQEQLARLSKQLRFGVVLERAMTFGCGCQRLWSAEGGVCRPRGFTLPSLRQDMLP